MEQRQQQQTAAVAPPPKLPAGLAGVLNAPEENRDSAYYSNSDASSKHNSTASCLGMGILTPPSRASYQSSPSDKTPSPTSTTMITQSLVSPVSSHMSVASMVSPTSSHAEPRRFDSAQSLEAGSHNAAFAPGSEQEGMSRRESVDSRINQGLGDMRLGHSPYASHNHSSTSIHNTLVQQRNPRAGADTLAVHRISNGYQPSAERNPEGHIKSVRTAPAITGPATHNIARAAEPTKGQAWAFPEEEIQRLPSSGGPPPMDNSRRSSVADSLASSQFTSESRLPPGQRPLSDPMPGPDFSRMSSVSADFPSVHHHTLQHKQLGELQSEELGLQTASQPYSRTPELRISHKLAERKRRTEMKELFEQLRDLMPQERGSKASKWEILTKAITEYARQTEQLKYVQSLHAQATSDNDMLRRELQQLRLEQNQMRADLAAMQQQARPPPQGLADPFAADQYNRAAPPRTELPPLRALSGNLANAAQGPESMTGVQFEQPRANGFPRQERY